MGKKRVVIFFVFIYLVTVAVLLKDVTARAVSSEHLAALCLESSLPSMELVAADAGKVIETEKDSRPKIKTVKKSGGKPKVLIYHTHATESYLPSTAGNYHTLKEENTVRDAGEVLAKTLESEGIGVIHDKTLHDNPSYNDSYSRSFETVEAILKANPSIECIVDLHRDATPRNVAGPVETVKGKTSAVYSYVLSTTTDTYGENRSFVSELNRTAAGGFDGYTGEVLERPYWYNQELSEKAILIEMGNNRNNIKDVRNCAKFFGRILAETLNGE